MREAETQAEGEAGSSRGARCGTRSHDPGVTPWAQSRRSTTGPPRCPENLLLSRDAWDTATGDSPRVGEQTRFRPGGGGGNVHTQMPRCMHHLPGEDQRGELSVCACASVRVCECASVRALLGCSCGCACPAGDLTHRLPRPPSTCRLLSQLPAVCSSGREVPGAAHTPVGEDAAKWSQIREDLCSLKVCLRLRREDGSVQNYKPQADRSGAEIFSLLPHMADMSTYMFKGIINFAKVISHFRELPIEDQISLLKGATFEVCQLRFNTLFNAETGTWECGRLSYCLEDPADRPGVVQRSVVDQLQERFAVALKAYIECNRPQPAHRFLFLKIMAMLTELRSINAQHTQKLLRIQDIHPFASPLMQELFSITDG
ncbi:nuclear receptor subfamily 1 group I member 2 isoform X2 [Vulpes vulpes]|uniref:Nuclear receptor subfamily 1 group I member 2 isoform X2 n=1 Tax=Vulpes vulpes TaxID=9627 RepID=A0ABM4XQY0_VULVU